MDYNKSDSVTGLGAIGSRPRSLAAQRTMRRASSFGKVPLAQGLSDGGLGENFFDLFTTAAKKIATGAYVLKKAATVSKEIGTILKPPTTAVSRINTDPPMSGVPSGSSILEPQLRDQTTVDGRAKDEVISGVPNVFLYSGIGIAALGLILLLTRRP